MTLSKEQINKIKIYLQEIGFKYLDVQMEILDHVATAVEEKMTENSILSFQDAVNQTRDSFGPNGFMVIEKSIVKGLTKKYNKLFFNNILTLFGFKYIGLVLLCGYSVYQLQAILVNQDNFFTVVLVILLILIVVLGIFNFKTVSYKKYMLYKISASYMGYYGVFITTIFNSISEPKQGELFGMNKAYFIVSFLITLCGLYLLAASKTEKTGILETKSLIEKYNLSIE